MVFLPVCSTTVFASIENRRRAVFEYNYYLHCHRIVYMQGDVGVMREELMWNGLFRGHAYSITHVLQVGQWTGLYR